MFRVNTTPLHPLPPTTEYTEPSADIRIRMSPSCWNPIRSPLSTTLLKSCGKSALEEAQKSGPELKERAMIVSKFTKGLGLTDADIRAFLYTYSNKQKQQLNKGNMRKLALYETLKEKKGDFVSPRFSAWLLQVLVRSSCIATLLVKKSEMMTHAQYQGKHLLKLFFLHFLKYFLSRNYLFFLGPKIDCL